MSTKEPTPGNVLDMHREVSIQFLKSTPAFAIRTPRGQKDPGSVHWDPRTNSRDKSSETIHIVQTTTDNLGIHLFGPVVDVDIDTDNPILIAALDYFLPKTNHVWGRPSRPRTHRLYELAGVNAVFDPEQFPFLTRIATVPDIKMEVRGGELKSGRYSLLPGSLHPSGEPYEWSDLRAARTTPVQTDVFRLMDGVRFACTAALLAPYWVEGSRNELCKALSGFMHRASLYTAELDVGLQLDKARAQQLLEGVMAIADDDPSDRPMRLKTFQQTWDKGDAGQAVTGATRIGEITAKPDIVPILYSLLAYTPDLIQLEAMFQKYAVIRNTTSVIDLSLGARGNYVMNKEAFVFTLAGQYISTPKGRVPVSAVFINSTQRTIVDRVSIDPERDKVFDDNEGYKCANVWSGWGIDPYPETVPKDDVEPFLNYTLKVLARGDRNLADWILMWIADIFQNPATKPGTALVLVGRQGAGKTFLAENVLRPIVGDAHFAKAGTAERLTSKFNSHMGGKLLIQGEEVINSNRRSDAEALKDAITSAKRTIEMKGRDSFEMDDYARYIFTSNHTDNAVNISVGDRRHTIAHVSDDFSYFENGRNQSERNEFWRNMYDWCTMTDEEGRTIPHRDNLARLHKYLIESVKIDRSKIRYAHETAIKRATQQNSNRGMDAWLLSMIECVNPFDIMKEYDRGTGHSYAANKKGHMVPTEEWPDYVPYTKLEQSLRQFTTRDYGEGRSAQQIAKFFKDNGMIPSTDEKKVVFSGVRVRIRPFPKRATIRDYLIDQGYSVFELGDDANDDARSTVDNF